MSKRIQCLLYFSIGTKPKAMQKPEVPSVGDSRERGPCGENWDPPTSVSPKKKYEWSIISEKILNSTIIMDVQIKARKRNHYIQPAVKLELGALPLFKILWQFLKMLNMYTTMWSAILFLGWLPKRQLLPFKNLYIIVHSSFIYNSKQLGRRVQMCSYK